MEEIEEEIKIILDEVSASKTKVDKLLEMDTKIYTNCGIDSTKAEMRTAKAKSTLIYKGIKKIDFLLGLYLLKSKD